jgi:hypothetical protein
MHSASKFCSCEFFVTSAPLWKTGVSGVS